MFQVGGEDRWLLREKSSLTPPADRTSRLFSSRNFFSAFQRVAPNGSGEVNDSVCRDNDPRTHSLLLLLLSGGGCIGTRVTDTRGGFFL